VKQRFALLLTYIDRKKTGIVLLPLQLTNSFRIPPLLKTEQEKVGSEAGRKSWG
jgi:hypothetical protein